MPSDFGSLDCGFLLLVHLLCVDRQIHNKELMYLNSLEELFGITDRTKLEKEKIIFQDDELLPVDALINQVSNEDRPLVMSQLAQLANIEEFCHPLELEFIQNIYQQWGWSDFHSNTIANFTKNEYGYLHKINNSQLDASSYLLQFQQYQDSLDLCKITSQEDY